MGEVGWAGVGAGPLIRARSGTSIKQTKVQEWGRQSGTGSSLRSGTTSGGGTSTSSISGGSCSALQQRALLLARRYQAAPDHTVPAYLGMNISSSTKL